MPPQQPDRLLDLVDDILDFRPHAHPLLEQSRLLAAGGCSDCAGGAQWPAVPDFKYADRKRAATLGRGELAAGPAETELHTNDVFPSLP